MDDRPGDLALLPIHSSASDEDHDRLEDFDLDDIHTRPPPPPPFWQRPRFLMAAISIVGILSIILVLLVSLKSPSETFVEETELLKSPNDKREYRYLHLRNDLRVVLISDNTTDKSSAAMSVGVGSWSDPPDCPGLAHFLEHMLFMGTEKYPGENDYTQYLASYGGSDNAFTSSEETNYFFDVSSPYFEGALDRFAQFFVKPLFK